ncbi:MAG: phosphotransferase [Chitinivibrionales bacterium]|nr:phosphotransferase [Chitinivibrionales bacterium]
MLLEMHCHTRRHSSCSILSPVSLIRGVQEKNLDGVVITDHCYVWPQEELEQLRAEAEVDRFFVILSGQEINTDFGHVLAFGIPHSITGRVRVDDIRAEFPDVALVWAHPWRGGADPDESRLQSASLDAIEIFNSNHSNWQNYMGLNEWHRRRFTAVAGSDAHSRGRVGILPTQLDHPVSTVEELAREIREGHCRPYMKEAIQTALNSSVTKVTVGTKGEDETRVRFVIKQVSEDKWSRTRAETDLLRIAQRSGFAGGRFRVPDVLEVNDGRRTIIEEGQRGRTLYNLLVSVRESAAADYLALSAQWLARLHTAAMHHTGVERSLKKERHRMRSYRHKFESTHSPYLRQANELIGLVESFERDAVTARAGECVQLHGDYQPRNILIGQDKSLDPDTRFISVVDFGSSLELLPAFDIGWFLSHFRHQLSSHPRLLARFPDDVFVNAYAGELGAPPPDSFHADVALFTVRGFLSIAAYLIMVGKGESEEMRDVMAQAEGLCAGVSR